MDKFNAHWDKLRVFYQVASIGTFSGAAEVLNTSQSALSRSILTLEKHIGARLFERSPRGLILTRQGEILSDTIRKINEELIQAQASLEEEENDPTGPIKISATTSFAALYLPLIMPEFLRIYPGIQLSIYGSDVTLNLHSNEVDVVIAPFIESDESLIQNYFMTFHLKLYASKEYLDKFGVPKVPSDLDHHQLLAYGDHQTPHPFGQANWHLTLGQKKGFVRHPHIMLNSAMGLFNFAVAGSGIVSLSEEHPFLNTSSLIEVLPSIEGPTIDAYFIHSSRTRKIKRIALLKDFLLNRLKNNLPQDIEERRFIK